MQSFNIFEELLVMKKKKIVFALGDKIDDFAHELIKRVFGISEAWMSNESTMDDFDDLEDIPGHSLVRLSDVPVADRHLYKLPRSERPRYSPLSLHERADTPILGSMYSLAIIPRLNRGCSASEYML